MVAFCLLMPVAVFADGAEDAVALYTAGVQKQQAAFFAQSADQHAAELAAAAEFFRKAIAVNPAYFDALIHLANVESELKHYDDSLQHLKTALAVPNISEPDKYQTQQAMAYVSAQIAARAGAGAEQRAKPVAAASEPAASEPAEPAEAAASEPAAPVAAGAGSPGGGVTWTTFTDPSEGAFHVEVPAGWKTEGGLTRASAIDCRPWVRVTSPDGSICAFIGDGTICPATCPTATLTATGFVPGSKYMGGLVLSYIPARQFAEKYAKLKLKPYMKDLQIVQAADHPDFARSINGTVGCTRSDAASIKIAGTVNGVPATGYYLCATKLTSMVGTSMWWVTYIAGEISTAAAEPLALPIALHMIQTFQLDPHWQQQSLATTKAVSQNYRAAANQISKSIVDRYWSQQAANESLSKAYWDRQRVQDHAANNFSDYIRGQQTVADPATGNQYKVYQANEHYINPMGEIMGTTGGAPDTDWRQLNNVP